MFSISPRDGRRRRSDGWMCFTSAAAFGNGFYLIHALIAAIRNLPLAFSQ